MGLVASGGSGGSGRSLSAMDKQFQAEDDLRTLERAEEIRGASHRMSHVKRMVKKRAAVHSRILGGGARSPRGKR